MQVIEKNPPSNDNFFFPWSVNRDNKSLLLTMVVFISFGQCIEFRCLQAVIEKKTPEENDIEIISLFVMLV